MAYFFFHLKKDTSVKNLFIFTQEYTVYCVLIAFAFAVLIPMKPQYAIMLTNKPQIIIL